MFQCFAAAEGMWVVWTAPCPSERRDESEVCEWRVCNNFRFLTVFGMTEEEGSFGIIDKESRSE